MNQLEVDETQLKIFKITIKSDRPIAVVVEEV